MIIGFFKSRNNYQPAIVIFISILFWIEMLIHPPLPEKSMLSLPVISNFFDLISGLPYLSVLLGYFLMLINSFLLNSLVTSNNLMGKNTYLPALSFVVIMCIFRNALAFDRFQVVMLILLFIIKILFKIYDKNEPFREIFNIGILMAILPLVNLPSAIILIFVFLVFIQFNIISWREWLILMIGIIVTYIFIVSLYFVFDRFRVLVEFISETREVLIVYVHFTARQWIYVVTLFIATLSAIVYTLNAMERNTVIVRKKFIVFVYLFLVAAVICVTNHGSSGSMALITLPSAVFFANYFQTVRRKVWRESAFMILLLIYLFTRIFI